MDETQARIVNALDEIYHSDGVKEYNEAMDKLDEVYRKAEAYDGKIVKPIEAGIDQVYEMFHECPECGVEEILHAFNFCPVCGVRLDWSDSQ